jgi:hypothetical protein
LQIFFAKLAEFNNAAAEFAQMSREKVAAQARLS